MSYLDEIENVIETQFAGSLEMWSLTLASDAADRAFHCVHAD